MEKFSSSIRTRCLSRILYSCCEPLALCSHVFCLRGSRVMIIESQLCTTMLFSCEYHFPRFFRQFYTLIHILEIHEKIQRKMEDNFEGNSLRESSMSLGNFFHTRQSFPLDRDKQMAAGNFYVYAQRFRWIYIPEWFFIWSLETGVSPSLESPSLSLPQISDLGDAASSWNTEITTRLSLHASRSKIKIFLDYNQRIHN